MGLEFYKKILEYYDDIFPLNMSQVEFVKNIVKEKEARVLEVGCANGKLTGALADYNIFGIDLDEDFIKVAYNRYPELMFKSLNMLNLEELEGKFAAILSFGNTLVHIPEEKVSYFFSAAYEKLNNKGKILLQIVNYDNILDNQIQDLSLIDNEKVTFRRSYINADKFIFQGELIVKKDGTSSISEVELFPLRKNKLVELLIKNKFRNIEVFGNFKMSKWNNLSPATIITAQK